MQATASTAATRTDASRSVGGADSELAGIVEECRGVLGSELHYQAVVYHCLRKVGRVPPEQLGMNVKMWIPDVVSNHFKALDLKKAPGFRGGFEPNPDVVIFQPEIDGDFRRRNHANTLRHMLMAIEIKASERHRDRLKPGEIISDVVKLDALRLEARHREAGVLPVVIVFDTAPDLVERMRSEAVDAVKSAAEERGVGFFYLYRQEVFRVIPAIPWPRS